MILKNHPAAVRRGGKAQVIWDVENKKPFEGEADAILLGLPKGVSVVGKPKLKAGETQLIFEIAASDEALLGQYKELTCEIVVREKGQEIRQRSGKGILRVDPALAVGRKLLQRCKLIDVRLKTNSYLLCCLSRRLHASVFAPTKRPVFGAM